MTAFENRLTTLEATVNALVAALRAHTMPLSERIDSSLGQLLSDQSSWNDEDTLTIEETTLTPALLNLEEKHAKDKTLQQ